MYAFLDTLREICHLLEPAEWAAVQAIVSAILLLSILYAYLYWRETALDQKFNSAERLFKELQSTEKDRADIIKKIILIIEEIKRKHPEAISGYVSSSTTSEWDTYKHSLIQEIFTAKASRREFDKSDEQKLRNIINSLNRIGLLVEEGIIMQKMIFAISYSAIIQSWVICEPYAKEQESLLRVRYARRVEMLANMAKNYADANRKKLKLKTEQDLKIYLFYNNTPIGSRTGSHGIQALPRRTRVLVHQTCRKKLFQGGGIQRVKWFRMRILENYSESLTFGEWMLSWLFILSLIGLFILGLIGLLLDMIGLFILGMIGLLVLSLIEWCMTRRRKIGWSTNGLLILMMIGGTLLLLKAVTGL